MEPVYIDLHIHTSENPANLVVNYDIDLLISKIRSISNNSEFLISLTDHNTINKDAYLSAKEKVDNLILGVELHIKNYSDKPAYHCHIYFKLEDISEDNIDNLNKILDELYPQKVINKNDVSIPSLEKIIRAFNSYEFVLLPHGGQSHSTFDKSVPSDVQFDSTIERSIYYNQFDGFTARSNLGLERTIEYFKKLGINEFVNLITCSDNYNTQRYPEAKASDASPFVPTWMYALPTFDGLRLSLSESSRFFYGEVKPPTWSEHITKVTLDNTQISIDVNLTPGLNVVIGGSSSGKTLFVDSLFNKIKDDFSNSPYLKYNVDEINVVNSASIVPHYISQSYINKVIDQSDSENTLDDIEIIKKVFPGDDNIKEKVKKGLLGLKKDLSSLIESVITIENEGQTLGHIPPLPRLLTKNDVRANLFNNLLPEDRTKILFEYDEISYTNDKQTLNDLNEFLEKNPFVEHNTQLIKELLSEIKIAFSYSQFESEIRNIIIQQKSNYDNELRSENLEQQTKKQNFEKLLTSISNYSKAYVTFYKTLNAISNYSISCESKVLTLMNHKLYIENDFKLDGTKFLEVVNKYLKTSSKLNSFYNITPESLFEENFSKKSPKVQDYDDFILRINNDFESLNKRTYKIITSDGRNYEDLSAGWKTSIILDLILGYDNDVAPLIIDQPEDNLATNYINKGLITAIKQIKTRKQIILVSHNAIIPMLGDAQNIIVCKNEDGKISILSDRLEGIINEKSVVDHIAEITDGGKSAIKKRVKKYNLKNYRG